MGAPDRYGVIGHPIAHSLSPLIHAAFARQTGERVVYTALDASPERFATTLDEFFDGGGRGLNVTAPHKAGAFALCASVTMRARIAGAVNTLWMGSDGGLHGDTTDGEGLVRDLREHLRLPLRRQRVLVLGAGGSVYGCLGSLLAQRPARVWVANRTPHKATDIAQNFAGLGDVVACALDAVPDADFDLVLNATAASLAGEAPPIAPAAVAGATCYDLMYAQTDTPFTEWAREHGARATHTGIGMLVEQAALSFQLWRGVRPDSDAVRALLTNEHGYRF